MHRGTGWAKGRIAFARESVDDGLRCHVLVVEQGDSFWGPGHGIYLWNSTGPRHGALYVQVYGLANSNSRPLGTHVIEFWVSDFFRIWIRHSVSVPDILEDIFAEKPPRDRSGPPATDPLSRCPSRSRHAPRSATLMPTLPARGKGMPVIAEVIEKPPPRWADLFFFFFFCRDIRPRGIARTVCGERCRVHQRAHRPESFFRGVSTISGRRLLKRHVPVPVLPQGFSDR